MPVKRLTEDIACVAAFLAMAERENLTLNARTGAEALEAFARLLGVPAFALRVLARDSAVNAIIFAALDGPGKDSR